MVAIVPIHSRRGIAALAFVDSDDLELVKQHRWHFINTGYAGTWANKGSVAMHRMILGLERGEGIVHHKNEAKLDNRRCNLVVCADRREAETQPHPLRDEVSRLVGVAARAKAAAA